MPTFHHTLTLVAIFWIGVCPGRESCGSETARPNVVLVMTDDQSLTDFGINGNAVIRTPHVDSLASESVSLSQFYVSPVCSATRASLMTGRYNYRTRVVDTWLGRSMMEPTEVTVAESLSSAGYATGIFGKWHLGDCYPMRPTDQGFQEALVHRGGGLSQPSDPPENKGRYTDPILFHNGKKVQTQGYCTDVYFRAAKQFIEQVVAQDKNFFVYLTPNAPHAPYHDVPKQQYSRYAAEARRLRSLLPEDTAEEDSVVDDLVRVAAMISNIDDNVGQLRHFLESKQLSQNTLFIFLCDNGPTPRRFVGDHRGMKCEVLEGGIRSPLWMSWPAGMPSRGERNEIAAHIDLMPTILDACGVELDPDLSLDGRSLLPLFQGESVAWPDREIIIQAHRGNTPERFHNFMIRDQRWKLVHPSGFRLQYFVGEPRLELYDMAADPGEELNLAGKHPEVVDRLRKAYGRWFDDVSATRPDNYAPPRIHVGTRFEPETVLTRNEWRGKNWSSETVGHWLVHVARGGNYRAVVQLDQQGDEVTLEIGDLRRTVTSKGQLTVALEGLPLSPGDCSVRAWASGPDQSGAYQIVLSRAEDGAQAPQLKPEENIAWATNR